jgi:Family of unknown function (DUF6152)
MTRFAPLLLISMLGLSGLARAHHSFARFDKTREVTLTGEVKEFQWTNPHSWIYLVVHGEDGRPIEWAIEFGSPNILARQGWSRNAIKAGDKITVVINPVKSGKSEGSLISATTADGVRLPKSGPANK